MQPPAQRMPPHALAAAAQARALQRNQPDDVAQIMPIMDDRFAWQPNRNLPELEIELSEFSDIESRAQNSLQIATRARVQKQMQMLQQVEFINDIKDVMRDILVVGYEPHHRLSEKDARSLQERIVAVRARVPDVADDDVWRAALQWPANIAQRLRDGLALLDAARSSLESLREYVRRSPNGSAPASAADVFALYSASKQAISSPLALHARVDGPACFIEDVSQPFFDECLALLRQAGQSQWASLGQALQKLKSGGGNAFDTRTFADRCRVQCRHLADVHDSVRRTQHSRVRWLSRRARYGRADFRALANDPSAWAGGVALERDLREDIEPAREEVAIFGSGAGLNSAQAGVFASSGQMDTVRAIGSVPATATALSAAYDSCLEVLGGNWMAPYGQQHDVEGGCSSSFSGTSDFAIHSATLSSLLEELRAGRVDEVQRRIVIGAVPQPVLGTVVGAGMTLIKQAINIGAIGVVEAALRVGADPAFLHPDRSTPLHLSAAKGGPAGLSLIMLLLANLSSRNAADVRAHLNIRNSAGLSPLHIAARHPVNTKLETLQCCLALISAGADPLLADGTGKSALLYLSRVDTTWQVPLSEPREDKTDERSKPRNRPPSRLGQYLFSPTLADAELVVPGTVPPSRIYAHCIVLAVASDVWQTMLEGDWAEGQIGTGGVRTIVLPPDISERSVRQVLTWAYTGDHGLAPGDAQGGLELMAAAVQLSCPGLLADVQAFLTLSLSLSTAIAIFDTARYLGPPTSAILRSSAGFLLSRAAQNTQPTASLDADLHTHMVAELLAIPATLVLELDSASNPSEPRLFDVLRALAGAPLGA